MLRIIVLAGPWAIPLVTLTVVLAVLIVRAFVLGKRSRNDDQARTGIRNAILFWGFVSAVLGFLGQCAALYRITRVVVTAPALSPELLAEGFGGSFVPTLWGVGLLLVSGLAWLAFSGIGRAGTRTLAGLLVTVIAFTGCSGPSPQASGEGITQGVWVGDGGADRFLFDLRGTVPDSLFGVVHVMRGGRKNSELLITRASYNVPDVEMFIASTNATYKGRVDFDKGLIRGDLSFGGEPGPAMDLRWMDPSDLAGFRALPQTDPYSYREPMAGDDGWPVATPEEVDLDRGAIEALVNAVARDEAGLIHSLLIVRNGRLVLDEYFHGFTPDGLHRLASTTKSISGLLAGAALDRGMISDLDVPLLQFFPEAGPVVSPGWGEETLHHLMSMSMGLDWTPEEAEDVHGTGEAFFGRVLGREVRDSPGTRWSYVSPNVNLLAGVIFKATGRHADEFARDVLFAPLGIRAYDWEHGKVDGFNLMDGSLQLRSRDLARIGTMVANGGRWTGRQVIGETWINEFTKPHFQTGKPLGGYGDLWWLAELQSGRGAEPVVVANGWGSQFIAIFPRLDMVVVTTGGNEDNGRHLDFAAVLERYLLSTV